MASQSTKVRKPRSPKPEAVVSPPSREQIVASIAANLPDDDAALLSAAEGTIRDHHAAVLACNDDAANSASATYDAIVWKMNGGTFSSSYADQDSPGYVIQRHCAAPDGEVPLWLQSGRFLVDAEGIRAWVEFRLFAKTFSIQFHAVDVEAPFISNTGFASAYTGELGATTVDAAARNIMRAMIKREGTCFIAESSRKSARRNARPKWLSSLIGDLADAPVSVFVDKGGQMAFAF